MMKHILPNLRATLGLLLVSTMLFGAVYPLLITAFAQMLFHDQATGSLIVHDEKVVGSELLGQSFEAPHYFWGRLSATTPPYNAAASGGSNFAPAHPELLAHAGARIAALKKADPAQKAPVPVDLVTASASGLDPHISVEAAQYQAPRIARLRRMKLEDVQELIRLHTQEPTLGFIGMARVNVLQLNMALDKMRQ